MMVNNNLVGGIPTPVRHDGVKVSWDDDYSQIWKVVKFMFQTTSQMKHGNSSPTNIWGKLVVSPWKIVKQLVIPFKHGDSRMKHTR